MPTCGVEGEAVYHCVVAEIAVGADDRRRTRRWRTKAERAPSVLIVMIIHIFNCRYDYTKLGLLLIQNVAHSKNPTAMLMLILRDG